MRVKYDRPCQRSIKIISIEKTFLLQKSAKKKLLSLEFFFKESSWWALFNHLKIANFEKWWFFTVDDTLKLKILDKFGICTFHVTAKFMLGFHHHLLPSPFLNLFNRWPGTHICYQICNKLKTTTCRTNNMQFIILHQQVWKPKCNSRLFWREIA